jgi:hypothetical protein
MLNIGEKKNTSCDVKHILTYLFFKIQQFQNPANPAK